MEPSTNQPIPTRTNWWPGAKNSFMTADFIPELNEEQTGDLVAITGKIGTSVTGVRGFCELDEDDKNALLQKAEMLAADLFCAVNPGITYVT